MEDTLLNGADNSAAVGGAMLSKETNGVKSVTQDVVKPVKIAASGAKSVKSTPKVSAKTAKNAATGGVKAVKTASADGIKSAKTAAYSAKGAATGTTKAVKKTAEDSAKVVKSSTSGNTKTEKSTSTGGVKSVKSVKSGAKPVKDSEKERVKTVAGVEENAENSAIVAVGAELIQNAETVVAETFWKEISEMNIDGGAAAAVNVAVSDKDEKSEVLANVADGGENIAGKATLEANIGDSEMSEADSAMKENASQSVEGAAEEQPFGAVVLGAEIQKNSDGADLTVNFENQTENGSAARPAPTGEIVLEATGLTKRYKKRHGGQKSEIVALSDVSFTVSAGEVVGFLGPNGAGKSTAIKLVTGLAAMDAGSVRIAGHDIKRERKAALLNVGGVIESPDLYNNMSALQLMRYFAGFYPVGTFTDGDRTRDERAAREERIARLLSIVGLEKRKNDLVKTYSLGMKQRLGIAQALLNKPKLLLLDEPANGLDPAGIREIREIIVSLAKNMNIAVLVSSHQLSEMQSMCDRVIILAHGKKVAEGNLDDMLQNVAKRKIRIRTAEAQRAAEIFYGKEGVVAVKESGGVLLSGNITAGDAAKLLVLDGVSFTGISEDAGKLEDLFFRFTEDGGAK